MATVMIADFSGMNPLRDGLLLPDNNAAYADNCWLYRGQVRGFRKAVSVYQTQYADTQQVYRIPKDITKPPDFTTNGSYWLEFPDPYMSVIRNPVVGDTWNRYYFFPSDQYASSGVNPMWPATKPPPTYNTLTRITQNLPGYPLGIPIPDDGTSTKGAPTVTGPSTTATLTATAATAPGGTVLAFASTTGVVDGANAVDLTTTTVTANTNAATAVGATVLAFPSTTGILVGMSVASINNPASIFAGAKVSAVSPTTVTMSIQAQMAIAVGDQIKFQNTGSIPAGTTISSHTATQATLSAAVVSAGVLVNDHIQFNAAQSETRSYLYTYVTQFNEEGPPSPATVATGSTVGTWTIVINPPVAALVAGRPIEWYRLYRTVTDTSGNATYYQVTQVAVNFSAPVTITDNADDGTITGGKTLDTIGYTGPPDGTIGDGVDLQGVVMMANGIAAGFTGADNREIWFSAAYLPHAWPAAYALTVDYPVVGLTANGTSLNIATQGSPSIATGVTPDTMTIGKITANEPCISRGSIVASGEGMYYASPNGIILLNTGGTTNTTQQIYEKEFHYTLLPPQWASGRYGMTYAAFVKGTPAPDDSGEPDHMGFVIDSTDANVPFSYMHFNHNVVNAMTDELSGQLFYLNAIGQVMQWNPPVPDPDNSELWDWEWHSKQFRFPHQQQFKAFTALFEVPPEITFTPGVRITDQNHVYDPTIQYLVVTVFADGRQIVIREVQTSGEVLLIPGGFKAYIWEFYFQGIIALKHFKAASSVKELRAT